MDKFVSTLSSVCVVDISLLYCRTDVSLINIIQYAQMHSSILLVVLTFVVLNAQLKFKFSSHCRMDSVYTAKCPGCPLWTHPSIISCTFLFSLLVTAFFKHLKQLSCFWCSSLLSFYLCSSGSLWESLRGWHGSLAWAHNTPKLPPPPLPGFPHGREKLLLTVNRFHLTSPYELFKVSNLFTSTVLLFPQLFIH